jgi:ketosteroid isomerase-like protein
MDATSRVVSLYPRLIDGDIGVLAGFADKATIDSPLQGHHEPPEFVAETRAWLSAHAARVEDVRTVVTPERVVHEFTLCVSVDGADRELPVMLVADIDAEDYIRDLRIYHSTWPLTGAHAVRSPLMQYTLTTRPPEPVGAYHEALAAGDAAAADAVFEPDGTVREPAGSAYAHAGDDRRAWYEAILSDGPLPLKLGTITDDGTTVVYEYEVERWGAARIPPQAGAAAYERGASGKIVSARIYDDIDPPAALGA